MVRRQPPPVPLTGWERPEWAKRTEPARGGGVVHRLPGGRIAAQPGGDLEVAVFCVDEVASSGSSVTVGRRAPLVELGGVTLTVASARQLAALLGELCEAVDPVIADNPAA